MRLIKLSKEVFKNEGELHKYFSEELPRRNPPGLFRITDGRIGADGLAPGETILFSYCNNLCFVTSAKTGRMSNTYMPASEYPYCIIIDLPPKRTKVPLEDLELMLRKEAKFRKSFKGSGWTIIPDSNLTEQVVKKLLGT